MSKGSISWVAITAAVAVIVTMILALAVDTGGAVREKIRIDTVKVTADRVSSAVYMIGALDRGKVKLELEEEYGLTDESGGVYINYTSGNMALSVLGNVGKEKIAAPVNFELESPGNAEELCLIKKSGVVEINRGGCNS